MYFDKKNMLMCNVFECFFFSLFFFTTQKWIMYLVFVLVLDTYEMLFFFLKFFMCGWEFGDANVVCLVYLYNLVVFVYLSAFFHVYFNRTSIFLRFQHYEHTFMWGTRISGMYFLINVFVLYINHYIENLILYLHTPHKIT